MNRRITVTILATVAAALLLAGAGTLVLTRLGARQAAEDDLRRQAESVADLIALGQQKAGLGPADQTAIRQVVCNDSEPTNLSATAREAFGRLRVVVCAPGTGATGVETARQQLCGAAIPRLDAFLPTEVKAARDAFCTTPTGENLTALRTSYCRADPPDRLDGAAQRRYEQLRRSLCVASRRTPGTTEDTQSLQSTLSKQSIELVGVTADGNLTPDSVLPAGLTVADLQPASLRQGLTVSGTYGADRVYAAAAVNPDAPDLSVVLVEGSADNVARRAVPWFLMASGITLVLGAAVAWGLSHRITEPLREATAVTARIADGDLTSRVPEHVTSAGAPRDEVDTLAHSINAMADSLERSRGLEQQFLLSVSHDLRTPLTSIRGYAEAIADGAAPDPSVAAGVILGESRRLERLVKDLLDLAKLDARRFTLHPTTVDLATLAADSVDGFRREATEAGVALTLHAPQPVPAVVDPDRTQQVVANLVENALKYADGQVVVTVGTVDGHVRLEVADDGPGIAAEDLPHVFERLYVAQADPVRKEAGSGLGLAIVRELVEAMGGTVAATANQPTGTMMVVRLPGSPPAPTPDPPR